MRTFLITWAIGIPVFLALFAYIRRIARQIAREEIHKWSEGLRSSLQKGPQR